MLGSKSGIAGMLLSTMVFAASASAQGTAAPAKPAPPKMPSVSASVKPVTPAKPATPATPGATPAAPAAPAAPKAPATGPRTIVGEVIDPACWIINGVNGKGHSECAAACARAGQTLAILERKTNKVYILAASRPGEDPNKGIVEYAGQAVLVKGRVYARGGALGIQVASIEPYNAKLATQTP